MADDRELQVEIERLRAEKAALAARVAALEARLDDACQDIRAMESLTARDVMVTDVQVARPGDTLRDLLARLRQGRFRRLPVVDADGRLVGIVTDRDVRLAANSPYVMRERQEDERLLAGVQAAVIMTPDPITASPETPLHELARVMRTRKIGGLPIVDDDRRLVGIVTETDLLRKFEELLAAAAGWPFGGM
mgnify:CR=1 FL=1